METVSTFKKYKIVTLVKRKLGKNSFESQLVSSAAVHGVVIIVLMYIF